jgi:hypothetical protein
MLLDALRILLRQAAEQELRGTPLKSRQLRSDGL